MDVGNLIRQSFVALQPIIPTKMDLYLCDLCGVAKVTQFDLKEHKRRTHDERKFKRNQCDVMFLGHL